MHTVGLARGTRIRQHRRVVVEDEAVARIRARHRRRHATSRRRTASSRAACRPRRPGPGRECGAHTANLSHRCAPAAPPAGRRTARGQDPAAEPCAGDAVGPLAVRQRHRGVAPAGFGQPHRLPAHGDQHVVAAQEGDHVLGGRAVGQHRRVAAGGEGAGRSRRSRSAAATTRIFGWRNASSASLRVA